MNAAACGVCGTPVVDGARHCHSCGAAFGAEIIDVGDTEPQVEGAPSTGGHGRRLAVLAGLGALAAILGLVLFAGGDDSDSAERELPTPAPTVAPIEPPEPTRTVVPLQRAILADGLEFEWVKGDAIGPTIPVEIVEHRGQLHFFGASELNERTGEWRARAHRGRSRCGLWRR